MLQFGVPFFGPSSRHRNEHSIPAPGGNGSDRFLSSQLHRPQCRHLLAPKVASRFVGLNLWLPDCHAVHHLWSVVSNFLRHRFVGWGCQVRFDPEVSKPFWPDRCDSSSCLFQHFQEMRCNANVWQTGGRNRGTSTGNSFSALLMTSMTDTRWFSHFANVEAKLHCRFGWEISLIFIKCPAPSATPSQFSGFGPKIWFSVARARMCVSPSFPLHVS